MNDIYLEHFGVKGMKWGVRKARKADAMIRRVERNRKINAINKEYLDNEAKIKRKESGKSFARLKDASMNAKLKMYAKRYDNAETMDKYAIEKAKAYKDKSHRKTPEYKQAQRNAQIVYGKAFLAAAGIYVASSAAQAIANRGNVDYDM